MDARGHDIRGEHEVVARPLPVKGSIIRQSESTAIGSKGPEISLDQREFT
jgi:hypothetical protein